MTTDYKTIELKVLRIFQREVAIQCQHALYADQRLKEALAQEPNSLASLTPIWFAIHGFLIATANISKLLWPKPSNKLRDKRRARLRASLGIADNSVLKLATEFRGHFEHLDERIEDWAAESERHLVMDYGVSRMDDLNGDDLDPGDFFRFFDPVAYQIYFRGNRFDMKPVLAAIEDLLPKARQQSFQPWSIQSDSRTFGSGQ